jgi:hypothetical protein
MTETTTSTNKKRVMHPGVHSPGTKHGIGKEKKFKPATHTRKIRLKIIPPAEGIAIEDIDSIGDILKVDVWEKNIKVGRYRLKDIKAKF